MSSSADLAIDHVVAGRYRVLGKLGEGGMGTVWRVADSAQGGREVALKTIRATGAVTPAMALAFREEYRAMTRLRHPNTIDVHDFGMLDATTRYLTMELVPGQELHELIGGKPMALEAAYPLLIQLLRALGFIHARLYVHRDIKAANVRVRDDGTLKLMDFGLMAQLGAQTGGGSVSGSPGYLPPEAIRGGTITGAADLYSVGCLAFEMLTGALPFPTVPQARPRLIEVVRAHLEEAPPLLRTRRPDAPEALERIVARLLAKDPCQRYAKAEAAIADLAALAGPCGGEGVAMSLDQARSYLVAGELVGRDAELAELTAALDRAMAGQGAAVLVGAPAGTGKSRLVHELLVRARLADALVLTGRCPEAMGAPYEPIAQALAPLKGLTPPAALTAAQPALDLLYGRRAPGTGELADAMDEAALRAAIDALAAWVTGQAAQRPIVLAFDDLHWADRATLDALRQLARRVAGTRVMIVGTLRDDEQGAASLLRAASEGGLTRVRLAPFAPAQVDALLAASLRAYELAPAVRERLLRATGGNPFFVTEALRLLMEEGLLAEEAGTWRFPADPERLAIPDTVEAVVLRRLAALGPAARHVAQAAAVIGGRVCRVALSELVAGREGLPAGDEEALFAALDDLVARQVLVREATVYTFFHDRVREAIYADLGPAPRAALHQGYAEYVERHADKGDMHDLALMAHHFGRGECRIRAARYHERAADAAAAAGALPCAISHWRAAARAVEAGGDPDRETRLARLYWEIGSRATIGGPEAAIEALEKLIPLLEGVCEADCWAARVRRAVALAAHLPAGMRDRLMTRLMTPEPYVHRPRRGLGRLLPPHLPSWLPRLVEAYGFLGAAYGFAGRPAEGLAIADRALALFPFSETPLEGSLRLVRCTNLFPAGRLDELLAEAARAQALLAIDKYPCPRDTHRLTTVASAGYRLAVAYQGRRPDADMTRHARGLGEAFGAFDVRNDVTHWPAHWAALSGRRAVARTWIDEAARVCRDAGAPPDANALYLDGQLRLQAGDVAGALAAATKGQAADHLPAGAFMRRRFDVLRGHALLAGGDVAAAREAFAAADDAATRGGLGLLGLLARLGLGEAMLAQGEPEGARGLLEGVRAAAAGGPLRNPLAEAAAERLLARADAALGDPEGARRRLERAMAIVGDPELDNPLEQAEVLLAMGEIRAAAGDRAQAAAALNRAADRFHNLGAAAAEARARAAIAALPPAPATAPLEAAGSGTLRPASGAGSNWMVARAFGL